MSVGALVCEHRDAPHLLKKTATFTQNITLARYPSPKSFGFRVSKKTTEIPLPY